MRIIIDLENEERHGDIMAVTFIGGLGTPTVTTCCNSVGLRREDKHFLIGEDGRIREVVNHDGKDL